jgi:hypothetical protein
LGCHLRLFLLVTLVRLHDLSPLSFGPGFFEYGVTVCLRDFSLRIVGIAGRR